MMAANMGKAVRAWEERVDSAGWKSLEDIHMEWSATALALREIVELVDTTQSRMEEVLQHSSQIEQGHSGRHWSG